MPLCKTGILDEYAKKRQRNSGDKKVPVTKYKHNNY